MELVLEDGRVVALEIVGDHDATPVLLCHGLADSRLAAHFFWQVARELRLRVIAPDRPGTGGTSPRPLATLADWADDATPLLAALGVDKTAVLGISGGGPFAAAYAARYPSRVSRLILVSPLGLPAWPTRGMAPAERLSLALARRAPGFGGWFLGRLATVARRRPELFLRLAATALPEADIRALAEPGMRESFLVSYAEAFRQGSWGVAQDLRVLTQPWGFGLGSIMTPTVIRHGDADTTVPLAHARLYAEAIPGAQLQIGPGHGHFSILSAAREVLAPLAA